MFCIVGERINTSRENVNRAVSERDAAYIQEDVKKQVAAGAVYIDVNAGARIGHEKEDMQWLLEIIQEAVSIPVSIDSPDPDILEMAYGMTDRPPMINSISLERARFETMIPFLKGRECKIVALCMDDSGMPTSTRDITDRAQRLVQELEAIGIQRENIYIDPLVQPISTSTSNGVMVLEAVREISANLTGVHMICGLSNVSFGLPGRKIINRTFLSMMMSAGLDGAICDPLDRRLMATFKITEMLIGRDDFCAGYLKSYRAGEI
jgi:5-methyltetrahydrofolate--homocysteine methyltransferase